MLRKIHQLAGRTFVRPLRAREEATAIVLSGLYTGLDTRDYVVLQDDVQRLESGECVAHVRVLRQHHLYVQSGTIRICDDAFKGLGATDRDRSARISRALIDWLQSQSMKLRFAVRVRVAGHPDGAPRVRFEENTVQSS